MVKPSSLSWLDRELTDLEGQGLRRYLTTVTDRRPGQIHTHDWRHDFSGNDYLGLSRHPALLEAAREGLSQGCGSGGSRIVTGGGPAHLALEEQLQQFTGEEACLVFPSGYQANLGVLSALCQPGDTIYSDAQNHASIVDGCRLSGARVRVYPHLQWEVLERWLQEEPQGRRWIVTDTLFSMDGTLAPLDQLSRLSKEHDAPLLVDEAHAMGVLGPGGRGYCAACGVRPAVLMGTFSKGLGSHGAFTAQSGQVAHWLVNRARSFIYTTALPPAVLAASRAALGVSQSPHGDRLRTKVLGLAEGLRRLLQEAGLLPEGAGTPLVSLRFDDPRRATRIQRKLEERGHLAWAFRPPTVEPGTSRLRISLSAHHTPDTVESLARNLTNRLSINGELP